MTIQKLQLLAPVVMRLGLQNVAAVAFYRSSIRYGLIKKWLPQGESYSESLFHVHQVDKSAPTEIPLDNSIISVADELLKGIFPFFSYHLFYTGSPPDWFVNPINKKSSVNSFEHWSTIGDFDKEIGDIKPIWEMSRFDWALIFARAFRQSGDFRFLEGLNAWTSDWIAKNPFNTGPNWKCGQEAGIRMLQVLLTAFLLRQHKNPTEALVRFVFEHCSRIEPTMAYAIAQNNNHGTSESAALFIGGAWLEKFAADERVRRKGSRWKNKGRRVLEGRVGKLIDEDGSFSLYSVNYHRLLMDTLNMVEFWRCELALEDFSNTFYRRCQAALTWLYYMVDEISGDASNLGPNDGARLFVLSNTDYRDFRATVQLGAVLFFSGKLYDPGPWDEPLCWLKIGQSSKKINIPKISKEFPGGGYVVLKGGDKSWGVLRYPKFRFRPGHADAFHLDLWSRGVNVLRDAGSFSYSAEEPWQSYFASTEAHNTVEFDGRDQMPAISRFLRGSWLSMESIEELSVSAECTSWAGAYRDYMDGKHRRKVEIRGDQWFVVDEIEGVKTSAVLRWRLAPDDWKISGLSCFGKLGEIQVTGDVAIKRFELVEGWESRYYLEKTKLPVLEVEFEGEKAVLTSKIHLNI